MAEIFDCAWRPLAERSSCSRKPTVRAARYGDGYEARWPAGLMADLRRWDLAWEGDWIDEIQHIDSFLQARGGSQAFFWAPPAGPPGYWVCREWRIAWSDAAGVAIAELTGIFEEVAAP